jgi:hypothetical protein
MFDITGDDIARLSDTDLRTLVARLAIAELAVRKLPISSVTAGGHQDAKDGGIDVRVDLDVPLVAPDFVARTKTGFQVKKQDMPASSISAEMRPKGDLRPAIAALADAEGAYIIVSGQGSVTDTALTERRQAMRHALVGHPKADGFFTDFYDRERLANWINCFPGIGAWVRSKIGGAVTGWGPIGKWSNTNTAADGGYLVSDAVCLIDERSKDVKTLAIVDGIDLLRTLLAAPRQCIRLIGMSGYGKTRLAQALFELGVGESPLDPALSVYTDYSDGLTPPAREMAIRLVASGQRAILVVDNCNPVTHGELVRVCDSAESNVSLLTIEYDVRADEPERTEVFRLTSASKSLIENWLARDFSHVSQVDRGRIAEFSDGNFRIARALAETLRRGESLGQLKDRQLFERIFLQRNDPDNQLLHDAEILALLYSFDGDNESADGELSRLAEFGERTVRALFGSIVELRRRGIIQARGRWRAVLPQAISNRLAASALERLPPGDFDGFCGALPPRMLRSISRRIGYLDDSEVAQATVARWLKPDGALGDLVAAGEEGLEILRNIAPVLPETVLMKINAELEDEKGPLVLAISNPRRWQWISLLKSLAYEPAMFERATTLLARFVMAEPPHHHTSAMGAFGELFQLYLSGTMAPPEQRRAVVQKLIDSGAEGFLRAGARALDSMLEAEHFTSISTFDFGARPRNFGWHPKSNGDLYAWYDEAINLAVDLASQFEEAKAILGRKVRGLWRFPACYDALDEASQRLASAGWIDGWIGFRAALRFYGKDMPDDIRERLIAIIERLKPVDPLDLARAFVLSRSPGGYDVADGEDDDTVTAWDKALQVAVKVGEAIGADRSLVIAFLPELVSQKAPGRAFEFGQGLARGADDLAGLWADLLTAYLAAPADVRNATVLGGFIAEAHILDSEFAGPVLDAVAHDPDLGRLLPYFQARVALDEEGLDRLRRAIPLGLLKASDFACLAYGVIRDAPAAPLISMLEALVGLDKGIGEALDILHMRLYCSESEEAIPDELLFYGRELLKRTDFCDVRLMRDFGLGKIVERCLAGPTAADDARIVCRNLRVAFEAYRASASDANHLVEELFKTQPEVALDCFLLDEPPTRKDHLFDFGFIHASPVERLDAATLAAWADKDPADRYPRLGDQLSLFSLGNMEEATDLSPLFLDLMARAPDMVRFLGDGNRRLSPSGWSGSLADVLEKRRALLAPLANYPDPNVKAWFRTQNASLDERIAAERRREIGREESFE